MRASLPVLFLLLAGGPFLLRAQTTTNAAPPNPQAAREMRMLSFLTPAERVQYATAREKALTDNPELKTEGEAIIKQGATVMASGSAADRQEFMERMNSHRQKLRQAMLKEDPTLEPIFAKIDKHISEMKAQQSNAAPAASPSTSH